jgi:murein L,D-transpeptidase YcbB/YkuD
MGGREMTDMSRIKKLRKKDETAKRPLGGDMVAGINVVPIKRHKLQREEITPENVETQQQEKQQEKDLVWPIEDMKGLAMPEAKHAGKHVAPEKQQPSVFELLGYKNKKDFWNNVYEESYKKNFLPRQHQILYKKMLTNYKDIDKLTNDLEQQYNEGNHPAAEKAFKLDKMKYELDNKKVTGGHAGKLKRLKDKNKYDEYSKEVRSAHDKYRKTRNELKKLRKDTGNIKGFFDWIMEHTEPGKDGLWDFERKPPKWKMQHPLRPGDYGA